MPSLAPDPLGLLNELLEGLLRLLQLLKGDVFGLLHSVEGGHLVEKLPQVFCDLGGEHEVVEVVVLVVAGLPEVEVVFEAVLLDAQVVLKLVHKHPDVVQHLSAQLLLSGVNTRHWAFTQVVRVQA